MVVALSPSVAGLHSRRALWLGIAAGLAALAALVLLSPHASAQCTSGPPANDCMYLGIGVGSTPYSNSQSTVGATMETGETSPGWGAGNSVWYGFTATSGGTMAVSACGSSFDTVLAAYSGTSLATLSYIIGNDDSCGLQSQISFGCTSGTTYWIQFMHFGSGGGGSGSISISGCSVTLPPAPPPPPPPPPAGCGYTVTPSITPAFVDLTGIGTGLVMSDDSSVSVNIGALSPPMSFGFCGTSYSVLRPASNGFVCLGPGASSCTDWTPEVVPSTNNPRPAVYGYYADLYPPGCVGGSTVCARWQVTGVSPNRVFIYMEKNVPHCCSSGGGPVSYEVKLFEGSDCIEVHYLSVAGDGSPSIGGFESASGTVGYSYLYAASGFALSNTAWRACPVPPFAATDDAFTLNEDQLPQPLDVLANDVNTVPGGLTINQFTQPTLGFTTQFGSDILYTPYGNANGVDSFTYTMENSAGDTATGTVTITLNAVNDPPTLIPGPDVMVVPGQGAQVIPGWGTGVSAGPAASPDEPYQDLLFDRTLNTDSGIFSVQPMLERTTTATATAPDQYNPLKVGTYAMLKFTPSGSLGTSTVCFQAHDDGGTATVTNTWLLPDTGFDTDAEHCFNITMNGPPVAYFEPSNPAAQPGQDITFNACPGAVPHCSYDPNDAITMWHWEFGDGSISDLEMPHHQYANTGVYVVRLTVVDSYGAVGSTVRTVTVDGPIPDVEDAGSPGVEAPVADAGGNLTVLEGRMVYLNGTQRGGSQHIVYEWRQAMGLGPKVTLLNSSKAQASFVAPMLPGVAPIDLQFSFQVTEGAVKSRYAFATVHVVSANHPPVADAGGATTGVAGGTVTLDGSGTSDEDGNALTYEWRQVYKPGDVVVAIDDARSAKATFAAPHLSGVLQFSLTVSDGKATAKDDVMVVIQPAGAVPAATFTYRVAPAGSGADVTFQAAPGLTDVSWVFSDGSEETGATVVRHLAPGTYAVSMLSGPPHDRQSTSQQVDVQSMGSQAASQGFAIPGLLAMAGGALLLAGLAALGITLFLRRRKRSA